MSFPDQSHINRVRDALWQRSGNGASVMVGSGFSRNAVPVGHLGAVLPTWEEVTRQLHSELYPQGDGAGRPDQLRTAQEYEAAFGKGALHDALRRVVRHEEHNPGTTHQRLLQLPWQDIFTTNWDTLLERTRSHVAERHYSVINSMAEIPMGKRPRIVKLHGSFPAQFPLIVTEEDYRTYPAEFAPFVNTVQQAMMETVFLLIGFSGEDPNFLNWSGWVRDNLGQSAPKIYLAGYLNLSPHRRRMLEGRGIEPIDLAKHPNANNWAKNRRPEYATEWLLHTLESGEPYKITEWPGLPSLKRHPTRDYLKPVDKLTMTWPKEEPQPPSRYHEPQDSSDAHIAAQVVRQATTAWKHNREIYPGWLVLPSSNRHAISWGADAWISAIAQAADALSPTERLQAIRELVWRKRISLEPLGQVLVNVIERTLEMFDFHKRTIEGEEAPNADWQTIRENWRNAATELLVEHRWNHNQEAFSQRVEELRKFADEDPEIQQRISQEQCLWALYDLDFGELRRLLADWQTENSDPAWAMRKSALLSEMGRDDEAEQLRQQAIESIRAMPTEERSIAGPSREGWAILPTTTHHNHRTIIGRMDELAALKCDAMHERDVITRRVSNSRQEEDPPSFDVGTRTIRHRFSNDYHQVVAAYQVIRLTEVAGLPPRVTSLHELPDGQPPVPIPTDVAANVLKVAADMLADWNHELAIRLTLRASSSDTDTTLQRVLTRTRVATLTTQQAENLGQSCRRAAANVISTMKHLAHQQQFDTLIEALSRLVVRMPPDQVETIFEEALEFCQNQQLAQSTGWTPIRHLLHRSWDAMPREYRRRRAIDLLKAPIAGLDGPKPLAEYNWPDPADLLAQTSDVLERTPDNEQQWQSAINLTTRGLTSNTAARYQASKRMVDLVRSGQLTDDETRGIATALWDEQYTNPEELPGNVVIFDWAFLKFPGQTPGVAEERFRNKWLSGNVEPSDPNTIEINPGSANGLNHNPQDVKSRLWQVGSAIRSLRANRERLDLSEVEKQFLSELVETWADSDTPERFLLDSSLFGDSYGRQVRAVARVLPAIIQEITLPNPSLGEKIYQKMRQLNDSQIPALELAPTVVKIIPTRLEDVATMIRVGMTSDAREFAASATSGIQLWLSESSDAESRTPPPPDDLIREIGVAIAYRRSASLAGALLGAQWIFESGTETSKEMIRQSVEDGLGYLATELSYEQTQESVEDIPLLRLLCADLAVAMVKNGQDQHSVVAHWLEIANEDPLPEVRNAVPEQLRPNSEIIGMKTIAQQETSDAGP